MLSEKGGVKPPHSKAGFARKQALSWPSPVRGKRYADLKVCASHGGEQT
jgi:hypothetical protein